MYSDLKLEKTLENICQILIKKYEECSNIGVLAGSSGISLFHFYYARYFNDENNYNVGSNIIIDIIERINNGYTYPTYSTGIAGAGWVLEHLAQKDFIELENDDLLSGFDSFLLSEMNNEIFSGNYDFLHGALGYGFFFLKRFENTKTKELKEQYEGYILSLLDQIERLGENSKEKMKWKSILDIFQGTEGYNLSLSHGISSIVNFLTRLYKHEEFRKKTEPLLIGGINYIQSFKSCDESHLCIFPDWIKNGEEPVYDGRVAWCYGDLTIAYTLWEAGRTLENTTLEEEAFKVMEHTALRRSPKESHVIDAGICHGSFGNAQIFNNLYLKTNNSLFKETARFWIEDGIKKANYQDGYAGFKQYSGLDKIWKPELELLEGIAGIGLVIIDYLESSPNSWDECLMIS